MKAQDLTLFFVWCHVRLHSRLKSNHDSYIRNKKAHLMRGNAWRKENRSAYLLKHAAREKIRREEDRNNYKARRRASQKIKLTGNTSLRLRQRLATRLWYALQGIAKSAKTVELLGCPITKLQEHLEKQFTIGMSWENYGPIWHVDHIKPCASFDLSDPEQQKQGFHFSNLQPLFEIDNLRKGAKYGAGN